MRLDNIVMEIIKSLATNDYSNSLNKISKIITQNLGVKSCSIMIYERQRNLLRLIGTSLSDKSLVRKYKIFLDEFKGKNKLKKGSYLVLEDFKSELIKSHKDTTIALFPMFENDNLIGALMFEFPKKIDLEKFESIQEFLQNMGTLISLLIKQDRLNYENLRLKLVEKLDLDIGKVKNLDDIFKVFLDEVTEILEVEYVTVWIFEEDKLKLKFWKGFTKDKILKDIVPNENNIKKIFDSEEPSIWINKKTLKFVNELLNIELKSAIFCPLFVNEKPFGLIMLANKKETKYYRPYKHLDEFEMSMMLGISQKISLLIENFVNRKALAQELKALKDLSEKYKELIDIQREQIQKLNAVYKISQAMSYSLDLNNIMKILLLGMISERGFNFDRAMLLMRDKENKILRGKMWLGTGENREDAELWDKIKQRSMMYSDFADYLKQEALSLDLSTYLNKLVKSIAIGYIGDNTFERVVLRKTLINVVPQIIEERKGELLNLSQILGTKNFVCIPLIGRRETLGVIVVDNKHSKESVKDSDIRLLKLLSSSAGLAIESVMNFLEIQEKNKETQRKLEFYEKLEEFSRELLNSIDAAIVVLGKDGIIREWNNKAEEFFGKIRSNVLGTHIKFLGSEFVDLYEISERVYDVRDTIVLNEYPLNLYEEKYFDIKFTPLWNRKTSVIDGVIIMFEDVTKRYKLERELRRQEKLAILGEIAARVAHEIRNPLTVIGGFAGRLSKILVDDKTRWYVNIIMDEVKRLESILSEILEFSRDYEAIEFEEFNLNDLVREIIELYNDKIIEKAIVLNVDFHKDELTIIADKKRMKQVLINLLKNAIDATNHGKIDLKTWETKEKVCFSIRNEGKPIPEEIKDKIFMPFFTTKTDGTGLGLPISKKIIEDEHSGRLLLETGENWNKFTIEIPKRRFERNETSKESSSSG